jgi:hypothetical protein
MQTRVNVDNPPPVLITEWHKNPLWASWASRIDSSNMFYVLPDEYSILVEATGVRPQHFRWRCGEKILYILGHADPNTLKYDIKWTEALPQHHILTRWSQRIHHERSDESKRKIWDKAFYKAWRYHLNHRTIARLIGKIVDLDMDSHNMTQTLLVLYALGYLWYWPEAQDKSIKDLALSVFLELHLKKEDHNPQFIGEIDSKRLIVDKLAAYVITFQDKKDHQNGWNIRSWIPVDKQTDYEYLKKEFGHNDLFKCLNEPKPPMPQFYYFE